MPKVRSVCVGEHMAAFAAGGNMKEKKKFVTSFNLPCHMRSSARNQLRGEINEDGVYF